MAHGWCSGWEEKGESVEAGEEGVPRPLAGARSRVGGVTGGHSQTRESATPGGVAEASPRRTRARSRAFSSVAPMSTGVTESSGTPPSRCIAAIDPFT